MKKALSILLLCGLLCLCACGTAPQSEDAPQDATPQDGVTGNYKAAVAAIDIGDYATAYDLLKGQEDEQSKGLLKDFVFVPTAVTNQNPDNAAIGSSVALTYDAEGRLLKRTFTNPTEAIETAYTYDADGRTVKEVYTADGNVHTTTYTYNADGRLSEKHYASGGGDIRYTFTYDEKGNLTEEKSVSSDGEETATTYQYNDAGKETLRRTEDNDGVRYEYETAYHDNGNVHTCSVRRSYESRTYIFEYDKQGRLWREWNHPDGADPALEMERTYDENGHLLQTHYPNTGGTVKYVYDTQGLLTETLDGAHHTVYTYDENGNLLTETRTVSQQFNREKRYAYDASGRVTEEVITYANDRSETTLFVYDEDGNVVSRTYTGFDVETDSDSAAVVTAQWTVFYYPDGVPEAVQAELEELAKPLTTIEAS